METDMQERQHRQRVRDERDLLVLDRLSRRATTAAVAEQTGLTRRRVNGIAREIAAADTAHDPDAATYWRTLRCHVSLA